MNAATKRVGRHHRDTVVGALSSAAVTAKHNASAALSYIAGYAAGWLERDTPPVKAKPAKRRVRK